MLNLKKEDWMRFGTIFLIVIFVLSTVAVYLGTYTSSNSPQGAQADTATSYTGLASSNATLVSYDTSLEVVGDNSELLPLIKQLKANNTVLHDISISNGRLVVLANESLVPQVSKMFEAIGLVAYADAVISTGNASVIDSTGKQRFVNSTTIRQKMAPIFMPGEQFEAQFNVQVVNSQIYATSQINVFPGQPISISLKPLNATIVSEALSFEIPWEQRRLNFSQFNASISPDAKANYTLRSYVSFNSSVPESVLQQISLSNSEYLASIHQSTMSIKPNYLDRQKIEQDLAGFGVKAVFPPSTLQIFPSSINSSIDAQKIKSLFSSQFPDVASEPATTYLLDIYLPNEIDSGGRAYTLSENHVQISSASPPSPQGMVQLSFSPVGSRVVQYQIISYSAPLAEYAVQNSSSASQVPNGQNPAADYAPQNNS